MNTQEQETPFLVFHRKFVRERSTIDRDMSLGVDLNCFDFIIIILNSIYGLECVDWWRESKPFSKPYYGYQQSDFFWKLANHGFCPNFIHCTRLGSFNCLKPYFLFHGEQHDIQHPDDGEFEHVGLSVNQFTTTTTTKYVLRTVGMCILLIHYQNKINRSEWSWAIHFILLLSTNLVKGRNSITTRTFCIRKEIDLFVHYL